MKHLILPTIALAQRRSMSDADIVRQDVQRLMTTRAGATPAALTAALERNCNYRTKVVSDADFILDVDGYVFSCIGSRACLVA